MGSIGTTLGSIRNKLRNNPDFIKSVITAYTGIAANIIAQVILIPLYLDSLGKYHFGILMLILGIINYLSIGITWATSGGMRLMGEFSANDEHRELEHCYGLTRTLLVLYALFVGCLVSFVAWLGKALIFDPSLVADSTIIGMGIAGTLYLLVLYDLNNDRNLLMAIGKQAIANILSLVGTVAFFIFTLAALYLDGGEAGVLFAYFLGTLVAKIISWRLVRNYRIQPQPPSRKSLRLLSRLGGRMGLGYAVYGIILLTFLQGDALILGALGGPEIVADFILVWKIADVGIQMLWRLPETLLPYLIHMDTKNQSGRLDRIFKSGTNWMAGVAFLAGLGYALFGPAIVKLWVGAENTPSDPWAFWLSGGAIFWLVSARLPAIYCYALVRLRPLIKISAIELTAKLFLIPVLYPFIGFLAPIAAINLVHIGGIAFLYRRLYSSSSRNSNG